MEWGLTFMGDPKDDDKRVIRKLADARRRIEFIVAEVNKTPRLAAAALANPLLALEEIGFKVTTEARREIEDHVRFGADRAKKLAQLRAELFKAVGRSFDPESEEDLRQVLERDLKIDLSAAPRQTTRSRKLVAPPLVKWMKPEDDPLADLREAHPAMAPLLAYRQLERSEPRLATRDLYEDIGKGTRALPVTSVRVILKSHRSQ